MGILPLSQNLELYGKVGATQLEFRVLGDKTRIDAPHLGAGVKYKFTDNIAANLGATYYAQGRKGDLEANMSALSLGIEYRF